MWSRFAVDTLTVDSQISLISVVQLWNESSSWGRGGVAYARDKIPLQDFVKKMQGGLCVRGAYLRDTTVILLKQLCSPGNIFTFDKMITTDARILCWNPILPVDSINLFEPFCTLS